MVLDNWWLNAIDPEGLKYLISATTAEEDDEYKFQQMSKIYKELHKTRENLSNEMKYEIIKI